MNWIILCIWAFTADPDRSQKDYIRSNLLAAKIGQLFFGIPPSIQFAQAITESGGGRSYISRHSNNHFGIKYYPAEFAGHHFTDRAGVRWRSYPNIFIGYLDHALFIWLHYRSLCFKDYRQFAGAGGYGAVGYWQNIVRFAQSKKLYRYD
jgi:flagellum-specific peptidoglycan hydrolase FlgJ